MISVILKAVATGTINEKQAEKMYEFWQQEQLNGKEAPKEDVPTIDEPCEQTSEEQDDKEHDEKFDRLCEMMLNFTQKKVLDTGKIFTTN